MNEKIFLDDLQLLKWFSQVGQGVSVLGQNNEKSLKFIDSLEEAVSIWQADYESRCDVWEKLRVRLLKNKLWENTFNLIRTDSWNILHDSPQFTRIAQKIQKQVQIEPEFFFSQLPIMGAWGEQLLNKENGFYSRQINLFRKGIWVCGYASGKCLIY